MKPEISPRDDSAEPCAECGEVHKGLSYPWLCEKFKPPKADKNMEKQENPSENDCAKSKNHNPQKPSDLPEAGDERVNADFPTEDTEPENQDGAIPEGEGLTSSGSDEEIKEKIMKEAREYAIEKDDEVYKTLTAKDDDTQRGTSSLSDKMKKIDWELTPELHLDDGRQYGGGVWLYFHGDVHEAVKKLKDRFKVKRRWTRLEIEAIINEEVGEALI